MLRTFAGFQLPAVPGSLGTQRAAHKNKFSKYVLCNGIDKNVHRVLQSSSIAYQSNNI
jgi:hypothetical protein